MRFSADWLLVAARIVTALAVLGPALQKFLDYPRQVEFFTQLGIPAPGAMVLVSGIVEVAAIIMLLFGILGRLGALLQLTVITVAIATAGLNLLSGIVLVGALVILLFGTGPLSRWQPEDRILERRSGRLAEVPRQH